MLTYFKDAIRNKPTEEQWLVAYENEIELSISDAVRDITPCDIGLWIGPEGSFSAPELLNLTTAGAFKVTLGRRILRTETAGLVAMSHLQCAWGAEKL
jgi:16S rRNA (uracil1498-N3)-methyltransferase